ncbi:lipocalin family protein [uncultured Formosa sp.]|uniref:lipocalin family protein n=1 Tax=uncultured Formosa sp. TaxID=255435 RepID=UPI00263A13FD|nr:lipocalin family protein [uncultured Formosa sp.]
MKHIIVILSLIILSSCSKSSDIEISNLNGYWEIEEVIKSDGTSHVYKINETVDFFEVNDSLSGYRQKMKTDADNNYTPVTEQEHIKVITENDSLKVHYHTPFSDWKETILELNNNRLKVVNQHQNVYIYKRYIPLNL